MNKRRYSRSLSDDLEGGNGRASKGRPLTSRPVSEIEGGRNVHTQADWSQERLAQALQRQTRRLRAKYAKRARDKCCGGWPEQPDAKPAARRLPQPAS